MIDTISMDYAFFGEADSQAKPVLILRKRQARWTEAVPVTSKGGAERWIARAVAEAIRRTGVNHYLYKTDQELIILDLKNKVTEELGPNFTVIMVASPVEEHASNRTVERAVAMVGGMIRALKVATEMAYVGALAADHAAVPWLI